MDFIESLSKSEGKDTIMVVVDKFMKYAHFIALAYPYSTQGVAQVFFDHFYKHHGLPTSIVTNMEKIFTNMFWK
jgi:hypothetical protein